MPEEREPADATTRTEGGPDGAEWLPRLQAELADAVVAVAWADVPVVEVRPERLRDVARWLKETAGFRVLVDETAVDYPERRPRFDLVVHVRRLEDAAMVRLRARVGEGDGQPEVPSLSGLWQAADWAEREVYDLFGIRFRDHPDLRRLLLPDDWVGHPLRKDYPLQGPRVLDPGSPYAH
jgi:NADH-quinone oxidoreductase subunit C